MATCHTSIFQWNSKFDWNTIVNIFPDTSLITKNQEIIVIAAVFCRLYYDYAFIEIRNWI